MIKEVSDSAYFSEIGGDFKGIQGTISGGVINQYIITQKTGIEIRSQQLIAGSPYLGLEKFEVDDKDKFFGRDRWILELTNYLEKNNVLLLLGASGSGKSSLIQAGLIPALKDRWGSSRFTNLTFKPGSNPFESFYACLLKGYEQSEAELARKGEEKTLAQVVQSLKHDSSWLIFIDQFEELFTRTPRQVRDVFIESLFQLTEKQDSSVKIILAMRADFLDKFTPYSSLGKIHDFYCRMLTDMDDSDLRFAIAEPAARNGVTFEQGLVDQIIADFKQQAGSLPLLQYTLDLLWERDNIHDRILNIDTYQGLGKVKGALQKQADNIYYNEKKDQRNLNELERKAAKQIFLELIALEGKEPVSKRTNKSIFHDDDIQESALEKLINNRLLVSKEEGGHATVEVAHEALLRSWKVLQDLIREKEELIILKNRLSADIEQWGELRKNNSQKASAELWSGSKLERIVELKRQQSLPNLDAATQEFIDASVEHRDRLLQQEKERTKRQLTVASITSAVFAGLAIFTGIKAREAQVGQINALNGTSEALLASNQKFDDLNALINSLKAGRKLNQVLFPDARLSDQVRATLQKAVYGVRELDRLEQDKDKGQMVSGLSPDGRKLANLEQYGFDCSWNNLVCLWDKSGEQMVKFLGSQNENLKNITFSPDRSRLIVASETIGADGSISHESPLTLRLWDLKSNKPLAEFKGRSGDVWSVSFSPDGSKIAIAGDAGIRLWDANGKQIPEFKGGQGRIIHVVFSPDGTKLATVNSTRYFNFDSKQTEGEATVSLWNLKGQKVGQLKGNPPVDVVIFSPDGTKLATTGEDDSAEYGTVRFWDLPGNLVGQFKGAFGRVVFSPDGSLLAGSGEDSIPRVWDLSGNQLFEFKGHQGEASGVIFSPDGKQLVTHGSDNTIRLWNLSDREFSQFKGQHEVSFSGFSFSPDSSKFATAEEDGNARLWDLSGKKLAEFKGPHLEWRTSNVIFSPDGNQLAVTGEDSILRLWDIKSKKLLKTESEKSQLRDGSFLLTHKDKNGTIHLWNWEGKQLARFKDLKGDLQTVSLNPEGNKLATVEEATVKKEDTVYLWDWEGRQLAQFNASGYGMTFSPDGKRLATTGDGTAQLWDLSGNQVAEFTAYPYGVISISFSPDSRLLATAGLDGIVKVWNVESKLQVAEFDAKDGGQVRNLTFSPDGKLLAIVRNDGITKFWRIESFDELMARGCDWARDYLGNNSKVDRNDRNLCNGINNSK